jgi:Excalibur calcium-binding domain
VPRGLLASTASADRVQPQPAPGSCHAKGSGAYSLPDRSCTPGAINPAVTQATIDETICVSGWTATVRPPENVTELEKRASIAAYGDAGSMGDFEYDHLVSLELGGAINDPRNLWPEPGASPNPKDAVENELHRMVCDGELRLARAQQIIATNWVTWARSHGSGAAPAHRPSAPQPRSSPAPSSGPTKPVADVNCSDFSTHAAAQQWFESHGGSPSNDVAGLDRDHDGLACESLP